MRSSNTRANLVGLPSTFNGQALDEDGLRGRVEALDDADRNERRLQEIENYVPDTRAGIATLLEAYRDPEAFWPRMMQEMAYVRNESETMPSLATHLLRPVYAQMCSWLGFGQEELFLLTPEEIESVLTKKMSCAEIIRNRQQGACALVTAGGLDVIHGVEMRTLFQAVYTPMSEVHVGELKGACASPGEAVGTVRIVKSGRDEEAFCEGDILVSESTCIDYVPMMRKASAVITDSPYARFFPFLVK